MRVVSIRLRNFWGFTEFAASLNPEFNLVVGDNGHGKTALLEGLSVGLGAFFLGTIGAVPARGIEGSDVRSEVHEFQGLPTLEHRYPSVVTCRGLLDGHELTWSRTRASEEGRTTRQDAAEMAEASGKICEEVRAGKPRSLPVLAYYGTRRLWRVKKEREQPLEQLGSRLDGYSDCLDPASNHKQLTEWMKQQAGSAAQLGRQVPHVAAIENAVTACIADAEHFYYNLRFLELRVKFRDEDGQELPFALLSDGYRNMIAMVADIAWRASVLNPHLGAEAARESEGVVLIDEIDLHLHPSWQRSVIGDLRRTFPKIQFIATTHSPQVIASAKRDWVLMLAAGQPKPLPVGFVEGKDSNAILAGEMGVLERPEEMKRSLGELFDLIDRGKFDRAREQMKVLEDKLGSDDSELVRARWLLDAEEGGAGNPGSIPSPGGS